jgi:hypothetical protein
LKNLDTNRTAGKFTIIRHSRLNPNNAEVVDEFEQSLAMALKEAAQREGGTSQIDEDLRRTILKRIIGKAASLITAEAVARIHGAAGVDDSGQLARSIRDELAQFVYQELVVFSGISGRGPKRKFADRDREIFRWHRKGMSYGRIGNKLKLSRHAVQAAFRREKNRRSALCEAYPPLKQLLSSVGILLTMKKRSRNHKERFRDVAE